MDTKINAMEYLAVETDTKSLKSRRMYRDLFVP